MSPTVRETSAIFPPPRVRLGPVIPVAVKPVEKLSAAMDNAGRVHLLAAMKSPKEVEYVVVDPDGRIHREHLAGYRSPTRTFFGRPALKLDIVTDGKGRLRAVVEDNALILEGGTWKQAGTTPCRQYVRAGSEFYCVFISPGKDAGASLQWEWFGFGGGPAGIIFPWPSYPDKLIVLREDGDRWERMTVIDPGLKGDVEKLDGVTMAGDARGTVHLLYQRTWALIFDSVRETRYVRLPATTGGVGDGVSRGDASIDNIARAGYYSTKVIPDPDIVGFKIAADPDSGTALLISRQYRGGNGFFSQNIRDDRFGMPREFPLPKGYEPRVVSAGSGDFHAAAVAETSHNFWTSSWHVYYLSNHNGRWSSPVELGDGPRTSEDTFLLVSDASRRAFVAWATDNGVAGRWVELEERDAGESSREKPGPRINRDTVSRGGYTVGIDPSRIVAPSRVPSRAIVSVHDRRKPEYGLSTIKGFSGATFEGGDIRFELPEEQVVRSVLEAELSRYLEKKGIRETRTYTSEIMEFRIQVRQTVWQGWKIAGQVRLVLKGREKEHILSGSREERKTAMPGEEIIQGVMEDSLRQAMDQLAAVEGDL